MNLKSTEYKTIEVAEDEDYGLVIGNIVFDKSKMLYAEIVGGTICNHEELANARAFLDEVDDAMSTETVNNVLNGCCDVEMLPDNFWSVVRQRDATIKQQSNAIEEFKAGLEDTEIKLVGCRKLIDNLESTIIELSAMVYAKTKANQAIIHDKNTEIESLKAELFDLKNAIPDNFWEVIIEKDSMIRRQRKLIEELKDRNAEDLKEMYDLYEAEMFAVKAVRKTAMVLCQEIINNLEAELSARKEDSEVFMKAVEIVRDDGIYPYGAINELADLLVDYLNAPEVLECVADDNTSCTVEMDIRCE